MNATHTPTPWKVDAHQKYLITAGQPNVDKGRVASCSSYDHSTNAEANAAHIVRCVNAHEALSAEVAELKVQRDELVAALRGLANADGKRLSDQAWAILYDDARAALAKAGAA